MTILIIFYKSLILIQVASLDEKQQNYESDVSKNIFLNEKYTLTKQSFTITLLFYFFKISKLKHQLSQAEERSNKFERDSKNVEVFQKKVSVL